MDRSITHYLMNEGAIKNYFNKVGKTIAKHHSSNRFVDKIKDTLDKHPSVKKQVSNVVKHGKSRVVKNVPRVAKVVWKYSTPKQKRRLLGAATGKILKSVATRIIGGPAAALASSISTQQSNSKQEEI
jgi:hypothetical protein